MATLRTTRTITQWLPAIMAIALLALGANAQEEKGERGRFRGPGGPPGLGGPMGLGGPFGGMGGDILGLVARPEVADAIKASEDEKAYVKLLAEETRDKDRERFASLRDLEPQERFTKMRDLMQERNTDVEKQLTEILGDAKVKRLKQIQLQMQGVMALANPRVSEEMNITEEQREKLRESAQQVEEELAELRRQKQEEKLRGIFTAEQMKKWEEMRGEPVQLKLDLRGRREGRLGGRGRPDAKAEAKTEQ